MRRWSGVVGGGSVLLGARLSEAAAMGIPLDAFLGTYQLFVIGLGLLIGLIGLAGWIMSRMENQIGHILHGSMNFFTNAGLLGGGTTLMGMLGLVGGATL